MSAELLSVSGDPVAGEQVREVPSALFIFRESAQDIFEPCPFIHSARLAGGQQGIDNCGSLGGFVIAAEQIVLPSLCWQCRYVGIIAYCIVFKLVSVLVHNIMIGILQQVLKWTGAIYDRK